MYTTESEKKVAALQDVRKQTIWLAILRNEDKDNAETLRALKARREEKPKTHVQKPNVGHPRKGKIHHRVHRERKIEGTERKEEMQRALRFAGDADKAEVRLLRGFGLRLPGTLD